MGFLKMLPMIWPIFRNIGLVIDTFRAIQNVVAGIAKRDVKIPNCEEARVLIGQVRKLLDSGVIDVPGIEEKDVSEVLGQIEVRIVCTIENVEKDLEKLKEKGVDLKGRNL